MNCSECQIKNKTKQFVYTTCSAGVLSLQFACTWACIHPKFEFVNDTPLYADFSEFLASKYFQTVNLFFRWYCMNSGNQQTEKWRAVKIWWDFTEQRYFLKLKMSDLRFFQNSLCFFPYLLFKKEKLFLKLFLSRRMPT